MKVGVIKETKVEEHRVALTPLGVRSLVKAGHSVLVEQDAGVDSGYDDAEYASSGARLLATPGQVAQECELLVKVKEPQPAEFAYFKPGLILFAYLHLAPLPQLTRALLDSQVTAVGYETVQLADGSLPLLVPMSQIAGRMAAEVAAHYLKRPGPGRGKLLGGISLAEPARCIVLGSGNVSTAATKALVTLGASVTVFGNSQPSLQRLYDSCSGQVFTRIINLTDLAEAMVGADILISGVLIRGETTPHLLTREMVRSMGPGAVLVDVSIDQGGVSETSRPTTHADPVYVEEGVIHYCVANMPGAVPRTSTQALTAVTLPYLLRLANEGLEAVRKDSALARGVNTVDGYLTLEAVAKAQGLPYTPLEQVFA